MSPEQRDRPSDRNGSRQAADAYSRHLWRLSGLGFTLFSEILAGLLIGLGLDHFLGTSPIWLVVGTVAGLLVGMTTFFRTALRASHDAGDAVRHHDSPAGGDATGAGDDDDRRPE